MGISAARHGSSKVLKSIWTNKLIYFMMLPAIVWAILFCYVPMYGVIIAFKDYVPNLGIWDSPWVGVQHFQEFFSRDFFRIMRNTLLISVGSLIIGFPLPILFAILVNGVKNKAYRATVQTISYMPHFVSWVVVSAISFIFFAPSNGFINVLLRALGLTKTSLGFLENGPMFIVMLILVGVWKSTGFSAIIFFAAISGVDVELYEAAVIDGASKLRRTWSITIPCIMPTIAVMLVLSVSGILNAGFEQQMVMANNLVWEWADVIDTYTYRYGLAQFRFSYGTAVGLFKSTVALGLLLGTNAIMNRKIGTSLYK